MALSSAVIEQGTSKVFSYISTKVEDKASRADTIARLDIALSRLDIALEKTGRIPITYISLLRCRKDLKRVYMEGTELLNKHKNPQDENDGHVVVRSSSYLQWIADRAANFSISSLVGLGKEKKLSSSDAQKFERYADWAEKIVADVESGCPLRHDTFRYPFLRHLLEGKTLRCQVVKNPSQSLSFYLQPAIVEGRGVEVILRYEYNDFRKFEECFYLYMRLRISEDMDIIGITIKCMQWWTAQFKVVLQSAIGELTLLPNLQDIFQSSVPPPSFMEEEEHAIYSKSFRPDPICCNGNSYGTLANKLSIEIPEPVIVIYFSCCISAPKNSLRNTPLILHGCFAPHLARYSDGRIWIEYGGKEETRNGGSVQQLEEIARSDALDYLVHEPEPTDYILLWLSTHGIASITLRQSIPRTSRKRVSKRKR